LKADVPADRTLNAFTFIITYDPTVVGVVEASRPGDALAGLSIVPNANTPGTMRVSGFAAEGVNGVLSLLDVTVKGLANGSTAFTNNVKTFSSGAGQDLPVVDPVPPLLITVSNITVGTNEIYWAQNNQDNTPLGSSMNLDINTPQTIRLMAQVPAGSNLKACNVTVTYDANIVGVTASIANSDITEVVNTSTPGIIALSGYNTDGITGAQQVILMDVNVDGLNLGTTTFNIGVNSFGENKTTQFRPVSVPLTVTVTGTPPANKTYWVDADTGLRFDNDQLTIQDGAEKVIRLMAEVPQGEALRACRFTLSYTDVIGIVNAVASQGSIVQAVNFSTPGTIEFNGYDNSPTGKQGTVALVDVTISGENAGNTSFDIAVNEFADETGKQFRPTPSPLAITVESVTGESKAYFADGSGLIADLALASTSSPAEKIRLEAVVPQGKTLKVYKMTLTYDPAKIEVLVDDTVQPLFGNYSTINTDTPGQIIINGFEPESTVSGTVATILGLTVKGKLANATDTLAIAVDEFAADSSDQFIPTAGNITNLTITVGSGVTYPITVTAGTGGSITPAGIVQVAEGASQTFTITANQGNSIVDVLVDGVSQGKISTYTFTNVVAAHSISATFKQEISHIITATAGTGGSITPSGSVVVIQGANQSFAITPHTNYNIDNVLVDGISQGAISTYTFANVTAPHTISATFKRLDYTITATAGTGGSISPSGAVMVAEGANQTFAITSNTGYEIKDVEVDGVSQGEINTYTFTNVTANHTISATFEETITYVIKVSSDDNGKVMYKGSAVAGDIEVNAGATPTFTFTANDGYVVNDVVVDGTSNGSIGSFIFYPVEADHEISVSFRIIDDIVKHIITVSSDDNGSVMLNDVAVDGDVEVIEGTTPKFVFTPNDGYVVEAVNVDDTLIGAVDDFTFDAVIADHTLDVTFKQDVCQDAKAQMTADKTTGDAPLTVNFDTTGSLGDLAIDFKDGSTATPTPGDVVTHTFQTAGAYEVVLKATDPANADCFKEIIVPITVNAVICEAKAVLSANPTTGYAPLAVTFTTAGSVGDLSFNYGDGQTGTSTTHTYNSVGSYTATLTAYDAANNCSKYTTVSIIVRNRCEAVATFTANPASGYVPLAVTFNTSGSFGSLSFDYGDGQSGTDTTHTYQVPDKTYTVTLTATDTVNGCSVKFTRYVTTLEECGEVAAEFEVTTDGLTAAFDTTGSVGTLTWNYGDGQTGADAFHTYAENGTYEVTLTATDPDNSDCKTTQTKQVTVSKPECEAVATFAISNVNFLAATFDATGSKGDLTWDFGDGASGTGTTVTHTYSAEGTYEVALTATCTVGTFTDTDTAKKDVKVEEEPVVDVFTITATAGNNGGIYPEGVHEVASGKNVRFTFMPDLKYKVSEVLVDGQPIAAEAFYKFENVTANHTIEVNFALSGNYYEDPQTHTIVPWEKRVEVDDKPTYFPGLNTEDISMVRTFDGQNVWGVQAVTAGVSIATLDSMGAMGLDTPNGHSMPLGLLASDYVIGSCTPSGTAHTIEVDIFLRSPLPSEDDDVRWIQYDIDNNRIVEMPINDVVFFNDDNDDGYYESVTLMLEDGGAYDLDHEVNCEVSDLSGLGIGIARATFTNTSVGKLMMEFETITETSSGMDMLIECITWNFGDGTEDTSCAQTSADGLHSTVTHTYADEGTYTVTLAVKGANGSQSVTRTIKVSVTPVDTGGGGGDNCFISASAYDSPPKSGMNIALAVMMLMTLAGMAVSFFRKAQK
jgi:PKD repeat protein